MMNTHGLSVGLEAPKVSKVTDIGSASLTMKIPEPMHAHNITHPILDQ